MRPTLGDPQSDFPQAVASLNTGQHPAIPGTDADLAPLHIQAIADTTAFHFAFIEIGGSSHYPTLAQRVTHPQVLRILLSVGPTETSHFQTWHDKAGNAVSDPLAPLTDGSRVFPNLNLPPFVRPFGGRPSSMMSRGACGNADQARTPSSDSAISSQLP
jgi:hypothetical protein